MAKKKPLKKYQAENSEVGSTKGFSISRNVTRSPIDEYGNREKTKSLTITRDGKPVRTKTTSNYKSVRPWNYEGITPSERIGQVFDIVGQAINPRASGNFTKESMVRKVTGQGPMTKTVKVNAENQTPKGGVRKKVTREYGKKGGQMVKKLPKAQPGIEMTDTIGTPAYDPIKVNQQKQKMLDLLYGVPTTPREYMPKIKRPSKGDTTPGPTTPGPRINPNTLEMKPGMSKIGGPITAMDKVQNFYKAKLNKGGKKK